MRFHVFVIQCKKVVLASIFAVLAGAAMPRPAAACHSACLGVQPPGCVDCKFTAFRGIVCLRGDCNFCQEDYCSVEASSPTQKLACEPSEIKNPQVKPLKVETLSPRS
jgi:hypothetical protein